MLSPLIGITVEITRKCFLSCVHCSALAGEDVSETLTLEEMEKVTDDFCDLGGKTLEISGGEPLCHQHIYEMIQYAKKNELSVHLFTCGVFEPQFPCIHEAINMDEKATELRNIGVDKIFVTLQGSNAETHDSVTNTPGSFKRTVNFIKSLIKCGIYVGIHIVPMKPNLDEFEEMLDYAANLGIQEAGILRFVPQGRGLRNKDWLMLTKDESARLIEMLNKVKRRKDIRVRVGSHLDFCFLLDKSHIPAPCTAGINKCLVKANGDIIPCAVFKGLNDYVVGNIRKSSLKELWKKSPIFAQFRNFDPRKLEGSCAECSYLSLCRGRCPAQRVYDLGNFYKGPDRYCPRVVFGA